MLRAVPKIKRLKDRQLIRSWPRECCEICGDWCACEAHHIVSVGSGGPDHPYNLITLCIWRCHEMAHKGILSKKLLFEVVANRENVPVSVVSDLVMKLRA